MSNPIRIVTRQGPQQTDPGNVGRSTAPQRLCPATAAALCAGLSEQQYAAVRLGWARDASSADLLDRLLYDYAMTLANSEGWRLPKGMGLLQRMVRMALLEHANPLHVHLPDDKGQRRLRWCGALRARLVEMEPDAWRMTWAKRYDQIYSEMRNWQGDAWRHIQRAQVEV